MESCSAGAVVDCSENVIDAVLTAATVVHRELGIGFRADIIVEGALLLELKSVDRVTPTHLAQVITSQAAPLPARFSSQLQQTVDEGRHPSGSRGSRSRGGGDG